MAVHIQQQAHMACVRIIVTKPQTITYDIAFHIAVCVLCSELVNALSLFIVFYLGMWHAVILLMINFLVVGHCTSFQFLPVEPSNKDRHMFDSSWLYSGHLIVPGYISIKTNEQTVSKKGQVNE